VVRQPELIHLGFDDGRHLVVYCRHVVHEFLQIFDILGIGGRRSSGPLGIGQEFL